LYTLPCDWVRKSHQHRNHTMIFLQLRPTAHVGNQQHKQKKQPATQNFVRLSNIITTYVSSNSSVSHHAMQRETTTASERKSFPPPRLSRQPQNRPAKIEIFPGPPPAPDVRPDRVSYFLSDYSSERGLSFLADGNGCFPRPLLCVTRPGTMRSNNNKYALAFSRLLLSIQHPRAQ
jgi:hypothetical protein